MGKRRTLLHTQKKRVFEIVRSAGLEPGDFGWSKQEADGTVVSRLDYRGEAYYFQFSSYEAGSYCIASPGLYQLVEHNHPKDWAEQEGHFRNWAEHLRREITCRDPWDELARYRMALDEAGGEEAPNETISGAAAREIGQQLSALADEIEARYELTSEQIALVRARLAYLAEAAMRQKSRDWSYSALGVCATLAMALSLSEEETARLWSLLRRHVGALVHLRVSETSPSAARVGENDASAR